MKGAKTKALSRRFEPWFGAQLFENNAGRVGFCSLGFQSIQKRCSSDALVVPPAGNLFEFAMRFAGHVQVKVSDEPKLFVKIGVAQGRERGFAKTKGKRH